MEPPDDDAMIARELRAVLAHPGGEQGFAALERRIMARTINADDPFMILARWARPALVAAAAAAVLAVGVAEWRAARDEQRIAVMSVVGSPREAAATAMASNLAREATLRTMLEP
jgi:hypothetical protein